MRHLAPLICVCSVGCAVRSSSSGVAPSLIPTPAEVLAPDKKETTKLASVGVSPVSVVPTSGPVQVAAENALALIEGSDSLDASFEDGMDEEEDDDDDGTPSADEGESHEVAAPGSCAELRYTSDLSDEQLQELWKGRPEGLGSISIGFVDEGRMVNAVKFPKGDNWVVVSPELAWGTEETVNFVIAAINKVREQYPEAPPLRVNQISGPEGGYLRPHKSHQNGRDADLGFYYPTVDPVRVREREKYIDVAKNWALLKALITLTDVQMILVDRRVQKVIYDYALESGEDKAWLDSIFKAGRNGIVQHARGHRDHFHVRFFNARAQELGRRVAPLLAQRPEQNLVMHRVRSGDTLGAIALRYNTTVALLKKANRMKNSFLRIAQVLRVPLRGPCTRCPIPPPVVVPERRLPPNSPDQQLRQADGSEVVGHPSSVLVDAPAAVPVFHARADESSLH